VCICVCVFERDVPGSENVMCVNEYVYACVCEREREREKCARE